MEAGSGGVCVCVSVPVHTACKICIFISKVRTFLESKNILANIQNYMRMKAIAGFGLRSGLACGLITQ